jgi:hypothetical protein
MIFFKFYSIIMFSVRWQNVCFFLEKNIQKIVILERDYWLEISDCIAVLLFQVNFQIFHEYDEYLNIFLTR